MRGKPKRVFALKRLRTDLELSQYEMGKMLGMYEQKYNSLESLTYDDLDKIADVLNVSQADLICERG